MQYLLLIYVDDRLLGELSPEAFDAEMKQCLQHADAMHSDGKLVSFEQLEAPQTARSVRVRAGRTSVLDGPFAETKEVLGGFAIFEFETREEALAAAEAFMDLHSKHWPDWEGVCEMRPMFGFEAR